MPHQCIGCDDTYEDGSESVLSGCASCGGTTFQYVPNTDDTPEEPVEETAPDESDDESDATAEETTLGDLEDPTTDTDHLGGGVIDTGAEEDDAPSDTPEDSSQHSARTDVVKDDDLPDPVSGHELPETTGEAAPENAGDYEVDLDALRQELNRQFEGIHIVAPGHYELNLMELYRREECIITLHEDGRYAIGVPGEDGFSLASEES